ncbi:MAG: tRNA threonylcarbamoyladenosine biosynthesis protein TsaE [Candidatus Poriferisodalaceae bacterium]|jgi:tRNA threonylcarbamoyladenosine biosynthesis protein TsaE
MAAALEPLLGAGDVLVLSGDLGAGKTAFVQGLAKALGITDRVTSPTFSLVQSYVGRLPLHHLDVYRLDNLAETVDIDLPELLESGAVVAIEWGEVVIPELPLDYLRVRMELGHIEDVADARVIEIEPVGPGWRARTAAMEAALAEWLNGNPTNTTIEGI